MTGPTRLRSPTDSIADAATFDVWIDRSSCFYADRVPVVSMTLHVAKVYSVAIAIRQDK